MRLNLNDSDKAFPVSTPSPTPLEASPTPTAPKPIAVKTAENPPDFERQVKITALADFLHNSNWSFYYPNENPLLWDERTAALKLKPILENFSWSDGEKVAGVYVCYNETASKTFLLVNLSWGEFLVVEPIINESYKNWSLYQIGRVYNFEDYGYRCDSQNS